MGQRIVRVAVGGRGRSGYGIHVAWLRQAGEQYQVVAVTDPLPDRREAVKDRGAWIPRPRCRRRSETWHRPLDV